MRPKHLKALAWAVKEAAAWRGALQGHPDPDALVEFDKSLATAREALALLRQANAQPRKA